MKKFSDITQRKIALLMEPQELNRLIYDKLKHEGYLFDEKEIELKFDFVKEGSPEYTTNKIKCNITITKDVTP